MKIKQLCIDSVAKKANAELEEFDFENREQVTEEIIDKVLLSYKERRGADCASEERVELNLMEEHGNERTLTVSEELPEKISRRSEALANLNRIRRY